MIVLSTVACTEREGHPAPIIKTFYLALARAYGLRRAAHKAKSERRWPTHLTLLYRVAFD